MRQRALSIILSLLLAGAGVAAAAEPLLQGTKESAIQDLGDGRYRLGAIEIDRSAGRFTVPGKVLVVNPPLEFLAVTKGGQKGYESLLELDTNAVDFNLACILLGLEPKQAETPRYHFDPDTVDGDPVEIWVSWNEDGREQRVPAEHTLVEQKKGLLEAGWTYFGSGFTPEGVYMAEQDGTLIGFVHDPASVIEHRTGAGVGNYGAVGANVDLVPAVGTPVRLTVQRRPAHVQRGQPSSRPPTPPHNPAETQP